MFALEIQFRDGVSQSETIYVRRPQAVVGASDYAHVVVEDLKELGFQLRLMRELGRSFRCKPVVARGDVRVPDTIEGVFQGSATFDLGRVSLVVTALDIDLGMKDAETPDRAGIRILREAVQRRSPRIPAVVVRGAQPMVLSFAPEHPIYIGRAKQCAARLDSADISARHARIGYEHGEFWVEDLGSTNGTFINQQQISGRVNLAPGVPIMLGREVSICGISAEDQIGHAAEVSATVVRRPVGEEHEYPALVSVSEVARPARVTLTSGANILIGRDPKSEMWLGAPHVSRRHCRIMLTNDGKVSITDESTNGTTHDEGILKKGASLDLAGNPRVLDFGGAVTVAICFNRDQERAFLTSHGAAHTFKGSLGARQVMVGGGAAGGNLPAKVDPKGRKVAVRPTVRTGEHLAFRFITTMRELSTRGRTGMRSAWTQFKRLYYGVGPLGRVLLLAAIVAVFAVVIIMVELVLPLFA